MCVCVYVYNLTAVTIPTRKNEIVAGDEKYSR